MLTPHSSETLAAEGVQDVDESHLVSEYLTAVSFSPETQNTVSYTVTGNTQNQQFCPVCRRSGKQMVGTGKTPREKCGS